jgi:hypothetical protein
MAMQSFRQRPKQRETGQVMLFVVLGLGLFLVGAMAFAIDLSNLWFNRQAAQTAADAACTAGAMDMLVNQVNGSTIGGFTPPNALDCTGSAAAPCQYAALNGFGSSILQSAANSGTIGNNVYVDFPSAANAPPGITAPSASLASNPFIRVVVTNNIQTWFAGLLGQTSQRIQGIAVCGLQADVAPIPIIVLHPILDAAFSVQGSPGINIIGGSSQSIQVNSCSTQNGATGSCNTNDAANLGGSAIVNLCAAGQNFCGANMGVFGKEAIPGSSNFITSCAGNRPAAAPSCTNGSGGAGIQLAPKFNSPQSPISDPFANTVAPTNPDSGVSAGFRATPYVPTDLCGPDLKHADGTVCGQINSVGSSGTGTCTRSDIENGACLVDYTFHGCADPNANAIGAVPTASKSCTLYSPGYYSSGIQAKNGVSVFDPGLYYLDPSTSGGSDHDYALALDSNSFVRPSFYTGGYYSVNSSGSYVAATVPAWFSYGDGGTLFYFNFPNASGCLPRCSVHVDSNSGKPQGSNVPDTFGSQSYLRGGATAQTMTTCPNGTAPDVTIPNITGNVLLAPCSLNGTWGNPGTGSGPFTSPFAQFRGILFFQDRGTSANPSNLVSADWGGGGQFLLAGTMYFHQCQISTSGTDIGTGCAARTPRPFNSIFHLGGSTSSGTYVLGEIITDQLELKGSAAINMQLNPNPANNVLKVALLQ